MKLSRALLGVLQPLALCAGLAISTLSAAAPGTANFRIQYAEAVGLRSNSIRPSSTTAPDRSRRYSLSFQAYGRQFDLDLQSNDRLLASLSSEQKAELSGYRIYRGQVSGLPGSWVRILQIDGELRGVIWDGAEFYTLAPTRIVAAHAIAPVESTGDTSMIYRLTDTYTSVGTDTCEVASAESSSADALPDYQALTAGLADTAEAIGASKRIQIAAVADKDFQDANGADTRAELLARMNIVDGIFTDKVGVHVEVSEVRILDSNGSLSADGASDLLAQFGRWRYRTSAIRNTALAHLVTGRNLNGSTVGIAYVGTLCDSRNGVSLSEGRHETTYSALIAAHEIGHNFGAPHDDEQGSACAGTPSSFLMAPRINGSREFSQCSLQQMQPKIAAAACITDVPQEVSVPDETGYSTPPETSGGEGGGGSLDLLLLFSFLSVFPGRRRRS